MLHVNPDRLRPLKSKALPAGQTDRLSDSGGKAMVWSRKVIWWINHTPYGVCTRSCRRYETCSSALARSVPGQERWCCGIRGLVGSVPQTGPVHPTIPQAGHPPHHLCHPHLMDSYLMYTPIVLQASVREKTIVGIRLSLAHALHGLMHDFDSPHASMSDQSIWQRYPTVLHHFE